MTTAADYLNQTSLLRLMAVLALVLSAHLARLPAWEILFILAGLAWRALSVVRQWPLPAPTIRTLLAIATFAGVFASYGRINGQNPGTALLVGMAVLKLMEMRSRRDVMVTVFLMYFILLTHFLYSQEIWTVAYLFACTIAITALLIEVNHPSEPLPIRTTLRSSGQMVLWSVPLMLLLFILFPRIPGPLWGLPSDSGAELTGIGDDMSPGSIAHLIKAGGVAMRVRFDGAAPPMRDRYWRGPVFDSFDGSKWFANPLSRTNRPPEAELRGTPLRYETTLEPHNKTWLFALDLPAREGLPQNSYITSEHQLVASRKVNERRLLQLASYTDYMLQPELSPLFRRINTELPPGYNPRAKELAQRLRRQNLGDAQAIVRAALQMFRSENFVYTLQPPLLGRDGVDEFLFDTRRGFCEHYAGAFAFLMRAAGVPTRVVAGYMGGEQNEFGDYFVIAQSDAHAWTEVWLDGRGWVRVDPTAAVSPDRIEGGLSSALTEAEGLPSFLTRRSGAIFDLQARWDWVNNQWNQWVLAYGPDLQQQFLSRFGLADWGRMIMALTIIGTTMLAIIGLITLRQFAPAQAADSAQRLWRRAARKLLKQGIAQRPGEGPRDFVERLMIEQPELGHAMQPVLETYLRLRYLDEPGAELERTLAAQVKALP